MQLGKLGVWAAMDVMTAAEGAAFARRVEGWGYAALWLPESRGRNVLVHSSWLLANTTRLIVATSWLSTAEPLRSSLIRLLSQRLPGFARDSLGLVDPGHVP